MPKQSEPSNSPNPPESSVVSITSGFDSEFESDIDKLKSHGEILHRVIDEIRRRFHFARNAKDQLHVFKNGRYHMADPVLLRDSTYDLLKGRNRCFITKKLVIEVEDGLHYGQPYLWDAPPPGKMSFLNGVLDLNSGKLTPHTPTNWLHSIQIPAKYDPKAKCPNWERRLSEWFPADAQKLAIESIAACITSDLFVQQAIWMAGYGGNGKSTLLTAIQNFLGPSNTVTLPLHSLTENAFATNDLANKLLMLDFDTPLDKIRDMATWKKVVSHDELRVEGKFKDARPLRPFCKVLMAGQRPPHMVDTTEGMYRRLVFVRFDGIKAIDDLEERQQQDIYSELETQEERSGLLNLLIPAWKKLRATGKFDFPPSSQEEAEDFRRGTDHIYQFWQRQVEITKNKNDYISKADLETAYLEFAEARNLDPKCKGDLTIWIRNKYHKEVKSYHPKAVDGTNGPYCHRFVRFRRT